MRLYIILKMYELKMLYFFHYYLKVRLLSSRMRQEQAPSFSVRETKLEKYKMILETYIYPVADMA